MLSKSTPATASGTWRRRSPCLHMVHQHAAARQHRHVSAAASPTSPSSSGSKVPVVVLPGFLQSSDAFQGLAEELRHLGHRTVVVPIHAWQWAPTLLGGDFAWYLDAAQQCVVQLSQGSGGQKVAIVGHSAGGWLARLLLGSAPYKGRTWDQRERVCTLLTLGAPHLSLEAYPFGRMAEKRPGEPQGLPEDVQGSSLRFANHHYPTGDAHSPEIRVVSVVGDVITGVKGQLGPRMFEPAAVAHSSYKANCGQGEVSGDGVCPVQTGLLPGSEHVILPGVWHTAGKHKWYGSPEVVAQWEPLLEPKLGRVHMPHGKEKRAREGKAG